MWDPLQVITSPLVYQKSHHVVEFIHLAKVARKVLLKATRAPLHLDACAEYGLKTKHASPNKPLPAHQPHLFPALCAQVCRKAI